MATPPAGLTTRAAQFRASRRTVAPAERRFGGPRAAASVGDDVKDFAGGVTLDRHKGRQAADRQPPPAHPAGGWRRARWGGGPVHLTFARSRKGIDTTAPDGRLFFPMRAAIAEFEHDLIVQQIQDGLAAARVCGRRGGPKPRWLRLGSVGLGPCAMSANIPCRRLPSRSALCAPRSTGTQRILGPRDTSVPAASGRRIRVRAGRSTSADVSFTNEVAPGMHAAVVRATKAETVAW